MKPQGFAKVKSLRKSLQQQTRQIFRDIRLGERKYSLSPLQEISQIESTHQSPDNIGQPEKPILIEAQELKYPALEEDLIFGEINNALWKEFRESAIADDIALLNFKELEGNTPFEYLLYSDKISRRNDGRLRDGDMRRYAHLSNGGWWCSGINILNWQDAEWGCFKPNTPRIDEEKGKPIKYEHPPKVDTEIFALRVPRRIWELVSRRYEVELPDDYLESSTYSDFWYWVRDDARIPIIICEGAKKAAAILSCGYVAIALPGIRNGYRQPKNEYGEISGPPRLIPQLAALAQQGRRIYFCFDADTKRNTIRDVNHAIAKTAKLFSLRGCEIRIMAWHSALGKGIDDVLAAYGSNQLDKIYIDALTLDEWNTKQLKRLTYTPDLSLDQRYLGEIQIPQDKQLIALKSPKNTGKTYFFAWATDPVIRSGERKVLVITHRVQLGLQIVERLGLPFVTETGQSYQGSHFGMGLCIDSLHPKSQAKFNPDDWKGCWIILDEIMQLIWHLMNSSTCSKERVAIIKTFKQLLFNVVNYGGKIFIADADLNDIAIDFIKGVLGEDIDTFIVENTFKFVQPWKVSLVSGRNPARLINILTEKIKEGKKCFVCLSGQRPSSRWGSSNLESYYQKKFPELKILRIDSKTVENPKHPAFGCTAKLNEIVKDYDLILSTPTIETGVSIEVEQFDFVFGIFQGVQTPDSVRQHLSRYRPPVPRFIWLNGIGINKVGNGSNNVKVLLSGEYRKNRANIKKLSELGFEDEIETGFENIYVNTWGKLGAIINDGMNKYSKQIIADLKEEGHIISEYEIEENKEAEVEATKQEVYENRDEEYLKHCEKVAASESVSDEKFQKLDKQRCKTEEEQLQHRKGELERRYLTTITPNIVEKDDSKWHSQIRLHYYFDAGREFLSDRDKGLMSNALRNGDGDYFMIDTNKNFISKKIDALNWLKFDQLLKSKEISNNDEFAIELFNKCKRFSYDLKLILGINFLKTNTPIEVIQRLLSLIGYKLPMLRKQGKRGNQVRIYGTPAPDFKKKDDGKLILVDGAAVPVPDNRDDVFAAWLQRDALTREKALIAKLEAEAQAAAMMQDVIADMPKLLQVGSEKSSVQMSHSISFTVEEWTEENSLNYLIECLLLCDSAEMLGELKEVFPAIAVKVAVEKLPIEKQEMINRWQE
ncbi:plasmid replication protein, CyRepA1 family [Anabaena azotica]|uniref:DUF3854 domain-containing protein n=1 Tax=Anabaena azotica FACHB-119 TaxID=947527 RepID=A0ABR8DBS1_9NOST|nr:plasmid replication protein, CyRepA1 family [Anabaena azotica]MBD2503923.1 DUF3854 domain-containing protein [Anabaena azotica FACHB-119]